MRATACGLQIANPLALSPQQPSALPLPAAFLLGLALVVQLLAPCKRQLELGAALLVEIELERHQRHSFPLDRTHELIDLAAVKQELAGALGRMVEAAALQIFRNIGVDPPDLAAARIRIRFGNGRLAAAQRLHLGAGERDAGLERLADLVVEARLAIVGDDANLAVRLGGHSRVLQAPGLPAGMPQPARTIGLANEARAANLSFRPSCRPCSGIHELRGPPRIEDVD